MNDFYIQTLFLLWFKEILFLVFGFFTALVILWKDKVNEYDRLTFLALADRI